MKKILSAVLAAAMLATTAMAATYTPGQKIKFDETTPGWSSVDPEGTAPEKEIHSDNYSITEVKWESGKDMSDSVKIDNDENKVVVTLKQDYTSTKEKELKGTIKLRQKGVSKYHTMSIEGTVGYNQNEIIIDADGNISAFTPENGIVYTVKAAGNIPYGTLEFSADLAEISVRVYEKDKFYLGFNVDPNRDVLLANADSDAEMSFLNFTGAPSFNSTATVNFFETDKDSVIYEIKNGKLVKSAAKWDEDAGCFVLKTKTLGSYVISDKELKSPAGNGSSNGSSNGDVTNPDTGANDVVGVATALAVVALVSAAAVSLKK